MNKQNMQQLKKYPPELFDAIRNFLAFNSSLEEGLDNDAFEEKLIKTIKENGFPKTE